MGERFNAMSRLYASNGNSTLTRRHISFYLLDRVLGICLVHGQTNEGTFAGAVGEQDWTLTESRLEVPVRFPISQFELQPFHKQC